MFLTMICSNMRSNFIKYVSEFWEQIKIYSCEFSDYSQIEGVESFLKMLLFISMIRCTHQNEHVNIEKWLVAASYNQYILYFIRIFWSRDYDMFNHPLLRSLQMIYSRISLKATEAIKLFILDAESLFHFSSLFIHTHCVLHQCR